MTELVGLVVGGKLSSLLIEKERLYLLERLADKFGALASKLPNMHSPAEIVKWLSDTVGTDEAKGVFEAADLADLYGKIVAARAWVAKIPEEYWRLLRPLGDFVEIEDPSVTAREGWIDGNSPGLVHITLSPPEIAEQADAGKLRFGFSASAASTLEAEAGALWPFRGDNLTPGLLRISAAGDIKATSRRVRPRRCRFRMARRRVPPA